MKRVLCILFACVYPLAAGIPSASEKGGWAKGGGSKTTIVPPADPLLSWFAGGSFGYLLDNESGMLNGHLGADLPWKLAGFDLALYGEIGWTQSDGTLQSQSSQRVAALPPSPSSDVHLTPLTLNLKLERPLFGPVNFYAGAGAGVAFVDLSLSNGTSSFSDDDTVFYAHAFAGLVANLNEIFEVYAGIRWIYLDQPDLNVGGLGVDLDDVDFSNNDFALEAGGRLNF